MNREAWLAERRTGIGGSDAAAALGLSKWKTPYQLWLEKRGEVIDTPDNWSMRWGRVMEPDLRQHYSDVTGRTVMLAEGVVRHPKHNWMLCTPDGGTDDGRLLEIKTARSTDGWGEPGSDQIPQQYLIQVQHSLCVLSYRVADVVLGIYGQEPMMYHVEADDELHEFLIDAEAEFWRRVQAGEPPEPVSYADAQARYGRSSIANSKVATDAVHQAVAQLAIVKQKQAALDQEEETLRAAVMNWLGENDTLVDASGRVLATWKAAKPAMRFDSKTFQATHAELYQQFLKPGEASRRFLLK